MRKHNRGKGRDIEDQIKREIERAAEEFTESLSEKSRYVDGVSSTGGGESFGDETGLSDKHKKQLRVIEGMIDDKFICGSTIPMVSMVSGIMNGLMGTLMKHTGDDQIDISCEMVTYGMLVAAMMITDMDQLEAVTDKLFNEDLSHEDKFELLTDMIVNPKTAVKFVAEAMKNGAKDEDFGTAPVHKLISLVEQNSVLVSYIRKLERLLIENDIDFYDLHLEASGKVTELTGNAELQDYFEKHKDDIMRRFREKEEQAGEQDDE